MSTGYIFIPLDVPMPPKECAEEIADLPWDNLSYWDEKRECQILPLRTPLGKEGLGGVNLLSDSKDLEWISAASFPVTRRYIEEWVWPWMDPRGNVAAIKTLPGQSIKLHLDSSSCKALNNQSYLKFRVVLQGPTSNLWFQRDSSSPINIPEINSPFLIDGSWPHGTDKTNMQKITLCIGNPWEGQLTPSFEKLLKKSADKFRDQTIHRQDLTCPST